MSKRSVFARRLVALAGCSCSLLFSASLAEAGVSELVVADFESSPPQSVLHNQDTSVSAVALSGQKNALDGSKALGYAATLSGPAAGWAGCSLPVAPARIPKGADTLELDARGVDHATGLFVTLTEADGSRWNANIGLSNAWAHYKIPVYRFRWFTGPASREKTRPDFSKIVSVDPWVANTFQGRNGFQIDNVRLVDAVPGLVLRLTSQKNVPLQHNTLVTLEASETTGGARSNFTGELLLDTPDRNAMNFPQRVEMRNGLASFEVFPRSPGAIELSAYEPVNDYQLAIPLVSTVEGLGVQFSFNPVFQGQQAAVANQLLRAELALSGGGVPPLSLNVEMHDHTGQRIYSHTVSVTAVSNGQARFYFPAPGLTSVSVRLLAEPVSKLPHMEEAEISQMRELWKRSTPSTAPLALRDGVTTGEMFSNLVVFEDIPSTATVLGEDHFTAWALAPLATEQALYSSAFALSSGALFHLSTSQIPQLGHKRLMWHERLGSFWGRNDLWWNEIEPTSGTLSWEKADLVVKNYRDLNLRFLGVLGYAAAWAKDKAPADAPSRESWRNWVSSLFARYKGKIIAYEVWNEPNGSFWKPSPDVKAYRELVRVTGEEARKLQPSPRIFAGALAGFDPVFLEQLLEGGFARYFDGVSFHPYPVRPEQSPEQNQLGEICDAFWNVLRHQGAGSREAWITELGWSTAPAGVSEEQQANYLLRAYVIALSKGIKKVFWFNLNDWEDLSWQGGLDAHLGLLSSNFRPKPAAMSYNLGAFMLAQFKFRGVTQFGRAQVYTFDLPQQRTKWPGVVHIAWTQNPGEEQDIELPIGAGGDLYTFDYLGALQKPTLISGGAAKKPTPTPTVATVGVQDAQTTQTYRFHVTDKPLYVWDAGVAPKPRTPAPKGAK